MFVVLRQRRERGVSSKTSEYINEVHFCIRTEDTSDDSFPGVQKQNLADHGLLFTICKYSVGVNS